MKKTVFTLIAALGLAACSEGMQTAMKEGVRSGVALEQVAKSSKTFYKETTAQVARSPRAVVSSLSKFSETCLQRATQISTNSPNAWRTGAGLNANFIFQGRMTNEDSVDRLVLFMQQGGGNVVHVMDGTKGFNAISSTRILSDGSGGTTLAMTTVVSYRFIQDEIVRWANGDESTCPNI